MLLKAPASPKYDVKNKTKKHVRHRFCETVLTKELSRRQPWDVSDDSWIRKWEIASKFAPCETSWRICILPTWCIYTSCVLELKLVRIKKCNQLRIHVFLKGGVWHWDGYWCWWLDVCLRSIITRTRSIINAFASQWGVLTTRFFF